VRRLVEILTSVIGVGGGSRRDSQELEL
jgi:hypothetical protein